MNGMLFKCAFIDQWLNKKDEKKAKKSQPEEGLAKDKIYLVDT